MEIAHPDFCSMQKRIQISSCLMPLQRSKMQITLLEDAATLSEIKYFITCFLLLSCCSCKLCLSEPQHLDKSFAESLISYLEENSKQVLQFYACFPMFPVSNGYQKIIVLNLKQN